MLRLQKNKDYFTGREETQHYHHLGLHFMLYQKLADPNKTLIKEYS